MVKTKVWIMNKLRAIFGREIPEEPIDRKKFLELEIVRWKNSPVRMMQIEGEKYYDGHHDILHRRRTVIGGTGELEEVNNLPNNRIVDNQFAKVVDQKANYLLSKPLTFETGDSARDDELKKLFNRQFLNRLKNVGVDSIYGGIGWLYVYYNEKGKLSFQRFKPYEVLPFWKDAEHTELDCAVRLYLQEKYEGTQLKFVERVEVFTKDGVERYELINNTLHEESKSDYVYVGDQGYNWDRIPLIAFKYNSREIPLIRRVKGLQDALNMMESDLLNNMQEDNRNTILVIKNYDGQNLGEFRKNLSTYGAVKVKTIDGADGDVEALKIDVNATNYDLVLKTLKRAIIENAMGFDAKDERLGQNSNMMNLKSMYSDIDLDADNMEAEYQASFEQLMYFVNSSLKGEELPVKVTFNRDIIVNETEVLHSLVELGIQLPNELLVAQVPFVDDVDKVMKMVKKEREDEYAQAFPEPKMPDPAGGLNAK